MRGHRWRIPCGTSFDGGTSVVGQCVRRSCARTDSCNRERLRRHQDAGRRRLVGRSPARCCEAGGAHTMKYLIVIEETATGYSAYSPDVPGCVATGGTRDEVEAQMKDAISFHLH